MRKIYCWADGTWCDEEDLEGMTHMSDDFLVIEIGWDVDEEAIDGIVYNAVNGR